MGMLILFTVSLVVVAIIKDDFSNDNIPYALQEI